MANKKIMISIPMGNRTKEEVVKQMSIIAKHLTDAGNEVIDSFFDCHECPSVKHQDIYCLAKSLELMANCDAVYFAAGWENARGCLIEHEVAEKYRLHRYYG